jgi:hypothetical protein
MASALSAISSFDGITLGYRTGTSGAFTTLTGFVVHKDRVPQAQFDERGHAEVQSYTATLKGPTTPALAKGYQVQVDSSASDIWTVESVAVKGQQICLLRRTPVITLGPDRGETR